MKVLLILNISLFVLQLFLEPGMTAVMAISASSWWQPWRYITFQFLHAGKLHLLFNMLGLWMIGAPLEKLWGGRKFLAFYLSCGVTAGVSYLVLSSFTPNLLPLVGASGGVYGLLLAAAVLLPHMRIIFLFFPVPIRLAVVILGVIVLMDLGGGLGQWLKSDGDPHLASETFSQMAHFGGLVMGGLWLLVPWLRQDRGGHGDEADSGLDKRIQPNRGRWAAKRAKEEEQALAEQAEVDRILDKISRQGLGSITRRERKILNDATTRQRNRDRASDRDMRL